LGFLHNLHFLELWKKKVLSVKRIKARHVDKYIGQRATLIGWPVTQKEVWTKDGLAMSFITFEDETAFYKLAIFPQIYDRYNTLLFDRLLLFVYGKVYDDMEGYIIEVEKAERIMKIHAIPPNIPPNPTIIFPMPNQPYLSFHYHFQPSR
jgi:DNA polymerase-3 subunit alpha/error-prone DNA polymerase